MICEEKTHESSNDDKYIFRSDSNAFPLKNIKILSIFENFLSEKTESVPCLVQEGSGDYESRYSKIPSCGYYKEAHVTVRLSSSTSVQQTGCRQRTGKKMERANS